MVDNKNKRNITRYYQDENVIEEFYKALANEDNSGLQRIHIPRSDVFYIRAKIREDTGITYPLDHVERAMYLEGHLNREDVFDPDRDWEYGDT